MTPPRLTATQLRRQHELTPLIDAIAVSENFDPLLLHALISQESRYNPTAVSPKGAAGLMQFMPGTAVTYGITPSERFDPAKSIRAGIRYLKKLSRMFGGNVDLILAGYNAGEGAVLRYGRKIPPFGETQKYVRFVKGFHARYRSQARQRQTRALLAGADDRLARARAAGGSGPERDPSRERATGSER
ncbi:MAG: lytic transglycosylase domain-containing protein [bacterium]|nr:lytic transglycosylase domain-containing protein [bacterium]